MAEPEVKPRQTGPRAHAYSSPSRLHATTHYALLSSPDNPTHLTDLCVPNPVLDIESTLRKRLFLNSL